MSPAEPTKRPRRREPLPSAFDPSFYEIWRRASQEEFLLPVSANRGDVVYLRQRLYSFRKALRESASSDEQDLGKLYERATLSSPLRCKLKDGSDGWGILLRPGDAKYKEALAAAGFGDPVPPAGLDD